MFLIKQMRKVGLGTFLAISLPIFATASPQKIIIKDGKAHTVNVPNGHNFFKVECDNMLVNIMAQRTSELDASIMATVIVKSGTEKKAFRIFDIAKDKLTPEHDISSMKRGCLTQEGGVGIDIPNHTSTELGLKIQIDARGRVFLGYDKTGLKLKTP